MLWLLLVAVVTCFGPNSCRGHPAVMVKEYPDVNYRPQYHLTCETGTLSSPCFSYTQDVGSLVYHVFFHCTTMNSEDWHHMTSVDLVHWQTAAVDGIPPGTTSISIVQPSANTSSNVMVIETAGGIYLGRSINTTLTQWQNFSSQPIISPPAGSVFLGPHIWSNSTEQFYLLVGSSLNTSNVSLPSAANTSSPVVYLYESADLQTWTSHGVFWKGLPASYAPPARSIDFFPAYNPTMTAFQQVMMATFPQPASAFWMSGTVNLASPASPFTVLSAHHADYGSLQDTSSVMDGLNRRLLLGTLDEMRSVAWQTHDGYAGAVSFPRLVRALNQNEIGFSVPGDVSSLYGKYLGRLTGITLGTGETELLPLLSGNQMTITVSLSIAPLATLYSAGLRVLASTDMSEHTTISISNNPDATPISCNAGKIDQGLDRQGSDYSSFEMGKTAIPSDCRAACCNDTKCLAWVFVFGMVNTIADCKIGSNCCFLKSAVPPQRASSLNITSGLANSPNSVLSVSTLKSSLNPEAPGRETHVPFEIMPPDLNRSGHGGDAFDSNRVGNPARHEPHHHRSNKVHGPPANELVSITVLLDHSVLEVFVHDTLVVTERVYPTLSDSIGVELFALNATATFSTVEGYEMESAV